MDYLYGFLLFLICLVTYITTLTPSVSAGDNGELTSAIFYLGLGHAPGYPIHTLFGKIFTFIPINNIGWRANFYSAFCGAMTIYFGFLVYLKLISSIYPNRYFALLSSIVGSLAFAFSYILWSQAITTEVYAVSSIAYGLLMLIILKWFDQIVSRKDAKIPYFGENYLLAFSFLLGVSLGGHQTISLSEFFFGTFIGFGLIFFQIYPRKNFSNYFSLGIWHFVTVLLILFIGWFFYIDYIVSLKSNLFAKNYANLKTGVKVFIFTNLLLLAYYLFYKFIRPHSVDPMNSFHRLALLTIKFMWMLYLGFCIYFYLFIRSHGNPPINWGGIDQSIDWWGKTAKFFNMINRKQFAASHLPFDLGILYLQIKAFLVEITFKQYTYPLWALVALGIVQAYRKCKLYLIWLLFGFVTYSLQLILYINYDIHSISLFFISFFFIFSYFIISIFIPFGVLFLLEYLDLFCQNFIKPSTKKNHKQSSTIIEQSKTTRTVN